MAREPYLYVGGKRTDLQRDETHVVIDPRRASGVLTANIAESATAMPGGLLLVSKSAVPGGAQHALSAAGALRPVYRLGAALAVPMPEIRIEVDEPEQHRAALAALSAAPVPFELISDESHMIVVRPASDSGEDALDLAAFVYERARPAASAPRMVQVIPRPGVRTG